MAKFKMQAGASIETLTQPELDKSLRNFLVSWKAELGRGAGFRKILRNGIADASGNLVLGGSDSQQEGLGPQESLIWGVSRINLSNLLGTPIVRAYINSASEGDMVKGNFAVTNSSAAHEFGNYLILHPGDTLLVAVSGLTAGTTVTLTGAAVEVPFNNAYILA